MIYFLSWLIRAINLESYLNIYFISKETPYTYLMVVFYSYCTIALNQKVCHLVTVI